jgi:hypothetical protein
MDVTTTIYRVPTASALEQLGQFIRDVTATGVQEQLAE